MLSRVFGAFPQTRALDVHSYVVVLRELLRECDSVFSFSASEFEDYRAVISKYLRAPVTFERMVLVQDILHGGLDEASELFVFLEFSDFVFSHVSLCRRLVSFVRRM